MRKNLWILPIVLLVACSNTEADDYKNEVEEQVTDITPNLCNPNATNEARQLYTTLRDLYGKKTLSGTVAHIDWNTKEAENVHQWTGRWPAINVYDFINIHASKDVNPKGWLDYSDMTTVSNWWNAGGIVGAMWHWQVKSNDGGSYTCTPGAKPNETAFDVSKISDPSSAEYKLMVKDIDQVAGYLKTMQKKGIPVIWRPLHEASGNTYEFEGGKAWFWWGAKGAEAYKKMWRFMYDRLVNHHKLNNLIWVWNSQMDDKIWYPGDDVVDIVGRDSYKALQYPLMKEFNQLQKEYPTKMITLAECGNGDEVDMAPWSKIWAQGSRWSWFMTWYDNAYCTGQSRDHQYADKTWWTDAFNTGTVIDRDQIKALMKR